MFKKLLPLFTTLSVPVAAATPAAVETFYRLKNNDSNWAPEAQGMVWACRCSYRISSDNTSCILGDDGKLHSGGYGGDEGPSAVNSGGKQNIKEDGGMYPLGVFIAARNMAFSISSYDPNATMKVEVHLTPDDIKEIAGQPVGVEWNSGKQIDRERSSKARCVLPKSDTQEIAVDSLNDIANNFYFHYEGDGSEIHEIQRHKDNPGWYNDSKKSGLDMWSLSKGSRMISLDYEGWRPKNKSNYNENGGGGGQKDIAVIHDGWNKKSGTVWKGKISSSEINQLLENQHFPNENGFGIIDKLKQLDDNYSFNKWWTIQLLEAGNGSIYMGTIIDLKPWFDNFIVTAKKIHDSKTNTNRIEFNVSTSGCPRIYLLALARSKDNDPEFVNCNLGRELNSIIAAGDFGGDSDKMTTAYNERLVNTKEDKRRHDFVLTGSFNTITRPHFSWIQGLPNPMEE